jgi:hypothetical protein
MLTAWGAADTHLIDRTLKRTGRKPPNAVRGQDRWKRCSSPAEIIP